MTSKALLLCVAVVLALTTLLLLPGVAPSAIVLLLAVIAFFVGAVAAFYWAVRSGQFDQLEKQACTIFDEDEPQGRVQDEFPKKVK